MGGGLKPSSNSGFGVIKSFVCDVIPHSLRNLKNIKRCRNKYGMTICRHATLPNKTYIASYRMNEVNCGIFQDITKRFRNAFHLCGMTNVKKLVAFTLAETLIVMGIIGIVSALTLPNLNSSTGEKEKVAKVKKLLQNLDDAVGRATAVYGPLEEWFQTDTTASAQTTRFAERMKDFLKISKNCGTNQVSNSTCYIGDGGGSDITTDSYAMILADGTSLAVVRVSPTCADVYTADDSDASCVTINVDLDGPKKGQNKGGYDQFSFYVGKNNGVTPRGLQNDIDTSTDQGLKSNCFGSSNVSVTCTGWVIQNGNMDYLKLDDNGKCPNGKTLNWTTNTTCK